MSWTEELGNIAGLVLDQYGIIILIGIIVAWIIYDNHKKKKRAKEKAEELAMMAAPKPAAPVLEKKAPKRELDLDKVFSDDIESPELEEENKDTVAKIKNLSANITNEINHLDNQLSDDFERLREELRNVNSRKREIQEHGQKLGQLFEKYKQREKDLTNRLRNLEILLKKKENP